MIEEEKHAEVILKSESHSSRTMQSEKANKIMLGSMEIRASLEMPVLNSGIPSEQVSERHQIQELQAVSKINQYLKENDDQKKLDTIEDKHSDSK